MEALWQAHKSGPSPAESVYRSAAQYAGKSRNLIERIRKTAVGEHRLFLIVIGITLPVLILFGLFAWAIGLTCFTAVMIWKFRTEIGMLDRIVFQADTLAYLRAVRDLIYQFMRIYRIGIMFLTPLWVIGGTLISFHLRGMEILPLLTTGLFWGIVGLSIVLTVGALRLWLYLWTQSLYGKKLTELDQLIDDLQA